MSAKSACKPSLRNECIRLINSAFEELAKDYTGEAKSELARLMGALGVKLTDDFPQSARARFCDDVSPELTEFCGKSAGEAFNLIILREIPKATATLGEVLRELEGSKPVGEAREKAYLELLYLAHDSLYATARWSSKHCNDCRRNRKRARDLIDRIEEVVGPDRFTEIPLPARSAMSESVKSFDDEFCRLLDEENCELRGN